MKVFTYRVHLKFKYSPPRGQLMHYLYTANVVLVCVSARQELENIAYATGFLRVYSAFHETAVMPHE